MYKVIKYIYKVIKYIRLSNIYNNDIKYVQQTTFLDDFSVFKLGILKVVIFVWFQMKIKYCPIFSQSHNVKDDPL